MKIIVREISGDEITQEVVDKIASYNTLKILYVLSI